MLINNCSICGHLSLKPICKQCAIYVKSETFIREIASEKKHKIYYLSFYLGAMERLLKDYKFNVKTRLVNYFAHLIDDFVNKMTLDRNATIFISLPSSKKGQKERGFNQVEKILDKCDILLYNCLVLSNKHKSSQQKTLNREKRINEVKGKFGLAKGVTLSEFENIKEIFVVDDVYTTGASINEAIRIIDDFFYKNRISINISGLVIAKSGFAL